MRTDMSSFRDNTGRLGLDLSDSSSSVSCSSLCASPAPLGGSNLPSVVQLQVTGQLYIADQRLGRAQVVQLESVGQVEVGIQLWGRAQIAQRLVRALLIAVKLLFPTPPLRVRAMVLCPEPLQ
ncbi:hypothetical protein PF010_g18113 [Phytophthora fragariae]|uniref:Uncharacterized protein n=1 Tax=Phytophthora fragariae TaxID=53985 RepID=A0A6G0KLT6_9STRA|nr:hypothetical protein PF010_g18113 [Phytophthora fragariae]